MGIAKNGKAGCPSLSPALHTGQTCRGFFQRFKRPVILALESRATPSSLHDSWASTGSAWFAERISSASDNTAASTTTQDWYFLFPGVWNYEFCVSAVNGELEPGLCNCVIAPQPGSVAGGPVGGPDCYSPRPGVGSGWGDPTPSCTSGIGPGNYADLCVFTCSLGFCPQPCCCLAEGPQVPLPASIGGTGYPLSGEDDSYAALCSFACSLGYCPTSARSPSPSGSGGLGGSGGAGGVIYLPPGVTNIGCNGDCTFILPPSFLPAPETISWPPLTTTLLSSAGGIIYTITTVMSIPVFTITQISYWSVTVQVGDPTTATFVAEQSVMPPPYLLNLPGNEATFPPSAPSYYLNFQPVPTTSSTTVVPVFFPGSYHVTIQPRPTVLISTPSPAEVYTYSSTSDTESQPTCTSNCGTHYCTGFGCGPYCGFWGCGGGCGLFGCGGGCGILGGGGCGILGCGGGCLLPGGCGSTSCPLIVPGCSNPGCAGGACPGPGVGETNGNGDQNNPTSTPKTETCATSTTVTMCEVFCSVTDFITTTQSGCGSTTCTQTITACSVRGTTAAVASTTTISCDAAVPYTPWWTDTDQLLPTVGVDAGGGYLDISGTWTLPSTTTPSDAPTATAGPTSSTAPKPSNTYDIYKWDSLNGRGQIIDEFYAAGAHAADWCISYVNPIAGASGGVVPSNGMEFSVCGVLNLINGGDPSGANDTFTVSTVADGGLTGTCGVAPGPAISACAYDGLDYTVYLANTCKLDVC